MESDCCGDSCDDSALLGRADGIPAKHDPSLPKLIGINAVVFALELCASSGFSYIPPLLLRAGCSETSMSIIIGIAPVLALLSVPVIGQWSDRCQSPMGKRRPFILTFCIFLLISMIFIPLGHENALKYESLSQEGLSQLWKVILGTSVVLLDYTSQVCFNPCEALMSDFMKRAGNPGRGFLVYSAMLSLGSCIGYLVSSINWRGYFPSLPVTQEGMAFYVPFGLSVICVMLTMVTAQEKTQSSCMPSRRESSDEDALSVMSMPMNKVEEKNLENPHPMRNGQVAMLIAKDDIDKGYESGSSIDSSLEGRSRTSPNFFKLFRVSSVRFSVEKIISASSCIAVCIMHLCGCFVLCICKVLYGPVKTLYTVWSCPLVLWRLFLADLLCWTAIMCHFIFYTDFMGQTVYKGDPDATPGSILAEKYDEGVRMGSWGLFLHCLFGFIQKSVISLIGLRSTYLLGMCIFSLSMVLTMFVTDNVFLINVLAAISGVGYSAVTTVPNSLLTMYHAKKEIYLSDTKMVQGKSGKRRGVATDLAVLDSAFYLSQIILSLSVGYLVDLFHSCILYMIVSAGAGFIGIILASRLIFSPVQLEQVLSHSC